MENLEKIYKEEFELYELLNIFAINGSQLKKKSFFIDIIKKQNLCSDIIAESIFKSINIFFVKKIYYTCSIEGEDEILSATVLQEKCEICNDEVEKHNNFYLYKFNKSNELSDYNISLLNKFISAESIPVVKDLKANFSSIIPFVGAGISKELGFPLWLEILQSAKSELAPEHHNTFNTYYDKGDIDELIRFIQYLIPSLDTDKKIKKDLIRPQVHIPLVRNNIENSTAHYILKLNSPYIITTNYDKSLEQINTEFRLYYNESKNLNNFSGFDDLDKEKFIFHIHGDTSDTDSMIVTKTDYNNMYENEKSQRVLTGLIMRKRLFFMGFSLNDKHFSKEFSDICAANKDYAKNYMICLEGGFSNNLIKENVNYITIKTTSIDKNQYDSQEQYRYLLNYIKGNIFIKIDDVK